MLCYYAEETVEQHILDLAFRKGTSLYAVQDDKPGIGENLTSVPIKPQVKGKANKSSIKGDFVAR